MNITDNALEPAVPMLVPESSYAARRCGRMREVTVGSTGLFVFGPFRTREVVESLVLKGYGSGVIGNLTETTNNIDTSTTGIKLSYTAPVGTQVVLTGAMVFGNSAGIVSNVELVRSAVTQRLAQFTTSGTFLGRIPLVAGDTIQWFVSTAIAASTADYTLGLESLSDVNDVFSVDVRSFSQEPADATAFALNGLPIYDSLSLPRIGGLTFDQEFPANWICDGTQRYLAVLVTNISGGGDSVVSAFFKLSPVTLAGY